MPVFWPVHGIILILFDFNYICLVRGDSFGDDKDLLVFEGEE